MIWIVVTALTFGTIFLMLEYLGVNDNVPTQSLVLLATINLVSAI